MISIFNQSLCLNDHILDTIQIYSYIPTSIMKIDPFYELTLAILFRTVLVYGGYKDKVLELEASKLRSEDDKYFDENGQLKLYQRLPNATNLGFIFKTDWSYCVEQPLSKEEKNQIKPIMMKTWDFIGQRELDVLSQRPTDDYKSVLYKENHYSQVFENPVVEKSYLEKNC